jgi:hypothetical protein
MKIQPGVRPAVWGAVAGAVAFALSDSRRSVGHSAHCREMATQRAETAVVAVLAPICVEKFQQPRCRGNARRVQQDSILGPALTHRERRLGYIPWNR